MLIMIVLIAIKYNVLPTHSFGAILIKKRDRVNADSADIACDVYMQKLFRYIAYFKNVYAN